MKSKTKLHTCLLALLCCIATWSVSAQTYVRYVNPSDLKAETMYSDSVLKAVMLPKGLSEIDRNPEFNEAAYELLRVMEDPAKELLQVWVCGSASPDGLWQDNVNVAQARTDAAASYLRDVLEVPSDKIHAVNLYEDWNRLAELVRASDIDSKEEILYIIANKTWGERKRALQQLDGGKAWRVLMKDFFPKLRCVRYAIFCRQKEAVVQTDEPVMSKDTVYVRDTVYYVKEMIYVPEKESVGKVSDYAAPQRSRVPRERKVYDTPLYIGIKTNVLADLLAIPQFGVELQLSEKLSFDLQGWASNYNIFTPADQNASFYGFAPELRWWKNNAMRSGTFFGVHGNCAWYTLQWKDLLYQNGPENVWEGNYHDSGNSTPAWSVGVTCGYVVGFGPKENWGLELHIGLGYGYYRQNTAAMSGNTWMLVEHQDIHHLGITRAGINLTYRFNVRRIKTE